MLSIANKFVLSYLFIVNIFVLNYLIKRPLTSWQVLLKAESHLEGIRSVKVIGCTNLDEVQVSMNSLKNFEYLLKVVTKILQ